MTLYARSDIATVAIGGVNHTHRRPMRQDGTPVKRWSLECDECEPALADDVLWSKNKFKIPLTAEEEEETKRLNEEANAAIERERIAAARALAEGVNRRQDESADDEDDKPATSDKIGGDQDEDDQTDTSKVEPVDYSKMSYPQLQKAAKERGLDATGKKEALVERLAEYDDRPAE